MQVKTRLKVQNRHVNNKQGTNKMLLTAEAELFNVMLNQTSSVKVTTLKTWKRYLYWDQGHTLMFGLLFYGVCD